MTIPLNIKPANLLFKQCVTRKYWDFFDQMAFYLQRILLIRHTHPFPQGNLMKIIKQQNQVESMLEEIKSKCIVCDKFIFLVTPCLYPACMQCYSLPV